MLENRLTAKRDTWPLLGATELERNYRNKPKLVHVIPFSFFCLGFCVTSFSALGDAGVFGFFPFGLAGPGWKRKVVKALGNTDGAYVNVKERLGDKKSNKTNANG